MKKTIQDGRWLPPHEEWDFRSITAADCRIACHWEYAREITGMIENSAPKVKAGGERSALVGKGFKVASQTNMTSARRDRVTKNPLFPSPWMRLTSAERLDIVQSVEPMSPLPVRSLQSVLTSSGWAVGNKAEAARQFCKGAYVIRPGFSSHGVESVIKEFKAWARREAKNHRQSPRAKAAELPFDLLKWLSVYRLDEARREAGLSYEEARLALEEYRRSNARPDPNDVFPVYSTHGAWSKAKVQADKLRITFLNDPDQVVRGHYLLS